MRLTVGSKDPNIEETRLFAKWLLKTGEGKLGGINHGEVQIDIPHDILIKDSIDPTYDLIEFVYSSVLQNYKKKDFFQERAILAPKNEVVQEINDILLAKFPEEHKEYLSSDSIDKSETVNEDFDPSLYSPDVLNGLKFPSCPNHQLILKVGVPVMLLRNIDQKNGLCNRTRLIVKSLGNRVIEVEAVSDNEIGKRHAIHRVTLTPTDKKFPFKFNRRQFPLLVCFAMTINKSQGQSLNRVGLFLRCPIFFPRAITRVQKLVSNNKNHRTRTIGFFHGLV
ncbi:uncharacterized protein LOC143556611 [Bidens hawaiensis]|uniref:uncharacterized protein LOC143556611 n=1 Tax=Bidens hawaiensis TaxID=980011 RepID=UPI00404A9FC4